MVVSSLLKAHGQELNTEHVYMTNVYHTGAVELLMVKIPAVIKSFIFDLLICPVDFVD